MPCNNLDHCFCKRRRSLHSFHGIKIAWLTQCSLFYEISWLPVSLDWWSWNYDSIQKIFPCSFSNTLWSQYQVPSPQITQPIFQFVHRKLSQHLHPGLQHSLLYRVILSSWRLSATEVALMDPVSFHKVSIFNSDSLLILRDCLESYQDLLVAYLVFQSKLLWARWLYLD